MAEEARWTCPDDVVRDLAKVDDSEADYKNYTAEVITCKGRGSRKREETAPGLFWIDPRTGEKIDLKASEGEEEEDDYMKYANDDIKAELRFMKNNGYTTGIGRGSPLKNTKESGLQLKKQLRTVNSHAMCNDLIEDYVNKEAAKRSSKKTSSPVFPPSSKKRSNPRYSSDSSSSFESSRLRRTSPEPAPLPKETPIDKVNGTEILNPPPSFKATERKRTNRNALIDSLLQHMEKKFEEEKKRENENFGDADESLKGSSLRKSEENDSGSNILSEIMTDDDVVVGSEVGNDNNNYDDDDVFKMDFKPRKPSIIDELKPKPFSDVARESENDILEFKEVYLNNFVAAQGNLDIGKNALADLEKKKTPRNRTKVFTNSNRSGNNNNDNYKSKEKDYEKLAERIAREKSRKKLDGGGIYDIEMGPFFSTSKNKEANPKSPTFASKPRFSDIKKEKENEFTLTKADFPSLG